MTESDLTPNLQALLTLIEGFAFDVIPKEGTFDPYGILIRRQQNQRILVFLETIDDSAEVLKGLPGPQMFRRIEKQIRRFRDDPSVESAALVIDGDTRSPEGGSEGEVILAWLEDRGRQAVKVAIFYEVTGGNFRVTAKMIERRDRLFLSHKSM